VSPLIAVPSPACTPPSLNKKQESRKSFRAHTMSCPMSDLLNASQFRPGAGRGGWVAGGWLVGWLVTFF
jgi:hypothetical protein